MHGLILPGGDVVVGGPCATALDAPWFQDWFRPIFDIAAQHGTPASDATFLPGRLPAPGEMRKWFLAAGLRDVQVQSHPIDWLLREAATSVVFLIQGLSFFQRQLELLPWQAREDIIEEVKRRGERVCRATPAEQRVLHWTTEFVKGVVPSA